MATTSTVPTVKSRLVTLLDAALSVPVYYAWPGPTTAHECAFIGRAPDVQEDRVVIESEIASIKAGRKHRTEKYTLAVTIWSFRPDLSSDGAEEAEDKALTLKGALEDALADDPKLGLDGVIQWARLGTVTSTGYPFEKGRVYEVVAEVEVQARLT